MEIQQLLTFGDFALKADESVLELDGKAVPLTPKMFDTLHVLVKYQGRIVEKETLMREVWPDSFVEEGNIAFNIRQLRKALGDSAQSPTYIETVPRRGYRFIAEVRSVMERPNQADSLTEVVNLDLPARRPGKLILTGIALFILLTATSALYFPLSSSSAPPILSTPFSSEKLSADGNVYHAVLAPDGKKIYYTHRDGTGKQSLWMRQIETANSVQILPPSDDFYGGIEVSPDGENVFFVRGSQTGPNTDIYRMPAAGGLPQKVVEGTQGWISVSPDGSKVSYIKCPYTEGEHCALYIADAADGKNERKLASRPRPIRISDNQISPDGRKVAFAAGQSRTASHEFGLFEVDLETGTERQVTDEKFFNIKYLAYLENQKDILITAMRRPVRSYSIWKVPTSSRPVERLTTDSESYSRLSLDARSSLLLATRVTPDFQLYVHSAGLPPTPIADAATVAFGIDGRLVFSSTMTGNAEIWSVKADGTDRRQLSNDPSGDIAPIVSHDGKHIFFASDRTGVLNAWKMNVDGTDAVQVTTEEGGYPSIVSPDGRWLYYRSGLNATIRRVEIAIGKEELVASELGHYMTVSPDASSIAFGTKAGDERVISLYSIAEQRVTGSFKIAEPKMNIRQIAWSADGKTIAYVLTDDKKENGRLYHQSVDGGPAKEIADLRGDSIAEMSALALSPDGRSFAVIKGNWKHDALLIKGLK
ncbi:MAG TPA: winged helix-turn-helix domain-containing protein [Pyrinomonadaceae bacterium]